MTPLFKINSVQAIALAGLAVALGIGLKRKLRLLDRLHIPASIIGGMIFAVMALAAHDRWVNIDVDPVLRDVLLIATFTLIGLNASLGVLRKGGLQVLWMAALASFGAVLQAVAGIGMARLFGLDPRIGLLAGTVSLAGGPSTSLAFGPVFERMGVPGATTLALASATFGITVAGLISGWTGGLLIHRHGLKAAAEAAAASPADTRRAPRASLLAHCLVLTVAMGLGSLISTAVEALGVVLPGFVGAMLAGVMIRNLDDRFDWLRLDGRAIDQILAIVLPLFISMAMLGLKLWQLSAVALPLLAILLVEVVLTWGLSAAIAFRVMGRDYQAAVMAAGFFGFMIGITPNAMASMEELQQTHGPAPRAFLVVPLVGAFLIDLANSAIITAFANVLRR